MHKTSRIYVAGHRGLVGAAICRKLESEGHNNLVLRTSRELDLVRQADVGAFFEKERPEYVFLAAAKVGGILANDTYRADFIYRNIMIEANVIHSAWQYGVKKLLFLGSSCIYPKFCPQPMKEEHLLTGELEPTNEPYAVAKIAGIKMCESYNAQYGTNFISVMPTNLYGLNDNYHPENSHVIPGLIRRFHEAKVNDLPEVMIWGTGQAKREFLFSEDLGDACVFLMQYYADNEIINIGSGIEVSIKELVALIQQTVDYQGEIRFDPSKPDGMPRRLLDVSKLHALGWRHKMNLEEGLTIAYQDFLEQLDSHP